jgi:hypothetical protein
MSSEMTELTEPTDHVEPTGPPRAPRTWVRTTLRWGTAAVLCCAVGAGSALAVMHPARTDIPGLATPKDARYSFPPLALPELPVGAQGPDATPTGSTTVDNNEMTAADSDPILLHLADLRQLLLPAPLGATPDRGLPGTRGWYPLASLAAEYGDSAALTGHLEEQGIRHVAATGWTTPDGTRTEIDLLAFRSSATGSAANIYLDSVVPTVAADVQVDTSAWSPHEYGANLDSDQLQLSVQPAHGSDRAAQVAVFEEGDVIAVVVMTNSRAVPSVDLRQVVILQDELLHG